MQRAPLFRRELVLLEPQPPTISAKSGERVPSADTEHRLRGERRDLSSAERFAAGLGLDEQVTRFLVRRGDIRGAYPNTSWSLRDLEREASGSPDAACPEQYQIEQVTAQDGRRDDDPHGVLTLTCAIVRGTQ